MITIIVFQIKTKKINKNSVNICGWQRYWNMLTVKVTNYTCTTHSGKML